MNIVAWADSAEIAHAKTAAYFERFDWHIVEVEEAQAIGQGQLHPHPHLPGTIPPSSSPNLVPHPTRILTHTLSTTNHLKQQIVPIPQLNTFFRTGQRDRPISRMEFTSAIKTIQAVSGHREYPQRAGKWWPIIR